MTSLVAFQAAMNTLVMHSAKDSPDRDLSARQICLLLACRAEQQTVRGVAEGLNVARPAITRAADRLVKHKLLDRVVDKEDRRSVLMSCTPRGLRLINAIAASMETAPTRERRAA